jgi:hypothetical protein
MVESRLFALRLKLRDFRSEVDIHLIAEKKATMSCLLGDLGCDVEKMKMMQRALKDALRMERYWDGLDPERE